MTERLQVGIWYAASSSDSDLKFVQIMTMASSGGHLRRVDTFNKTQGRVAQLVTCPATDACLTADPGVVSSIPVWSHTFVEIGPEIISTVILLPSPDSYKKGCCPLQGKVCVRTTGSSMPRKSVVRCTDHPP